MQYFDILSNYVLFQIEVSKLVEIDRQTEFPSGLEVQ